MRTWNPISRVIQVKAFNPMTLATLIPSSGIAATAVIAGLYIFGLFLTAITSRPPAVPSPCPSNQDAQR